MLLLCTMHWFLARSMHLQQGVSCHVLLSSKENKNVVVFRVLPGELSCCIWTVRVYIYMHARQKKKKKRIDQIKGKYCLVGGVYMDYIPPTMQCRPNCPRISSFPPFSLC